MPIANARDPQLRLRHARIRLHDAIDHLRDDIRDLDEPELRAILSTSAEVLTALVAALDRYEQRRACPEPHRLRRSG